MEWYHWVIAIVGTVVGLIVFWFITYFLIAPAIITAFNLDVDPLAATLIIFFGGDSGVFALIFFGRRRMA